MHSESRTPLKASLEEVLTLDQARFVRELLQLYGSGHYSIKAVRQKLTTNGFRTNKGNKLSKSQIHKILRNPFCYGEMEWRG